MTKNQITDLQAVILCGPGQKLGPLTDDEKLPKCLLPVANRPMIYYPLTWLHQAGIHDVMVIAHTASAPKLQSYLTRVYEGPKPELHLVNEYQGTMDALLSIRPLLAREDSIVLSCDLITDFPLGKLIERARVSEALAFIVLATPLVVNYGQQPKKEPNSSGSSAPGNEPKHRVTDEAGIMIGIDAQGEGRRLLSWTFKDDLEENVISASMATLTRYSHMRMRTDLHDVHCYLLRKELFKDGSTLSPSNIEINPGHHLLEKPSQQLLFGPLNKFGKSNMFSLREDGIPRLVNRQFGSKDHYQCEAIFIDSFNSPRLKKSGSTMDGIVGICGGGNKGINGNVIRMTTSVIGANYCLRVNTLSALAECSKQLARISASTIRLISQAAEIAPKAQIGSDSLIGDHSKVGDKSSVKRSVIGNHVIIGINVKISNSLLLDYVTVESGVRLEGCIVGAKAVIKERSYLKDCDVGGEWVVERETTAKGELLGGSRDIYLDDIDESEEPPDRVDHDSDSGTVNNDCISMA